VFGLLMYFVARATALPPGKLQAYVRADAEEVKVEAAELTPPPAAA
jgi:hypothetical protein